MCLSVADGQTDRLRTGYLCECAYAGNTENHTQMALKQTELQNGHKPLQNQSLAAELSVSPLPKSRVAVSVKETGNPTIPL